MSHDKVQLVRGAREKRKVTSFGEKVLTTMTRTIALVLACLTACNIAAAPQDGGEIRCPQAPLFSQDRFTVLNIAPFSPGSEDQLAKLRRGLKAVFAGYYIERSFNSCRLSGSDSFGYCRSYETKDPETYCGSDDVCVHYLFDCFKTSGVDGGNVFYEYISGVGIGYMDYILLPGIDII